MTTPKLLKFHRRRQPLVDARWRELLPALTIFARQTVNARKTLESWEEIFYRRLHILFDAGVRWESIRILRMDWPIATEEGFISLLNHWRARSERYGRRTGSHEHYAKDFEKRYAKEQTT